MAIRVVLIEDHLLALQAMSAALKKEPDIEVVATTTGKDDPLRLARETRANVVILDAKVRMPGTDPVTMVVNLKRVCPAIEVLVLIGHDDDVLVSKLIDAGVRGCLFKTDEQTLSLGTIVRRLSKRELLFSQRILQTYFDPFKPILALRELSVLRLAAEGLTNGAIAEQLMLSDSTVRNYLFSIYAKLGISKKERWNPRVVAINKARKLGLL